MAGVTVGFGIVLVLLGAAAWLGTGRESITALIPAFFGLPITLLGGLARKENLRKHAMHAALLLTLLGLFGTLRGVPGVLAVMSGEETDRPAAAVVQSIMALLCLMYLVLGVKSFVDARRARTGGA